MKTGLEKLNDALMAFSQAADAIVEAQGELETGEQTPEIAAAIAALYASYPFGECSRDFAQLVEAIAVWQTNVLLSKPE